MIRCFLPAATALAVLLVTVSADAQQADPATDQHKLLQMDVGTWDAKLTIWPEGPDGESMTMPCSETCRMLGGGKLWNVAVFQGEFGGHKFTGHGQFGYDPAKKKYVGTWIDTNNPYLSVMSGDYDAEKKTMTMLSVGTDPQTGKPMVTKNITTYHDKDKKSFVMYLLLPDDKQVKMMAIDYTRKKK